MTYWLVILFCVAGGPCESRLLDRGWSDELKCRGAAFSLIRARVGYRPTFICLDERPDGVRTVTAPVAPEQWT